MKKICIISDIHANLYALKKFLEYIDEKYDIEYILNLGDFVQNGPNPCEVFDIVMRDKRFINIMGNCEYELIYEDFGNGLTYDGELLHETWTIQQLGQERISMLKELHLSRSVEIYGKKIFMHHANSEMNLQIPFECGLSGVLRKVPLDTFSEEDRTLIMNEHDYLLVAINHIQGIEQYKIHYEDTKYSYIQPGAIGCLDSRDIEFAILEIDENEENIIFKTLQYNSYEVIEECIKRKVPDPCHGIYINKIIEDKEAYSISLCNRYATDVIPMDFSFCGFLIMLYLEKYKYVQFDIWNEEKELLEELKREVKIVSVKYSEHCEEIFIEAEIDEKLKQLVTNKYLNVEGLIKWFNIEIYNEKENCDVHIGHYGCEIYLENVKKKNVDYIKSIINTKKVRMQQY